MTTTKRRTVHTDRKLPHAFRVIRLELAREPEFPMGNPNYGYRLIAPLDQEGRINPALWKQHRDECKVVRFKPNEVDEVGHLVRKGASAWAFHYDIQGHDGDEAGYRLGDERFEVGEYVSIKDERAMHTFKVTSVEQI